MRLRYRERQAGQPSRRWNRRRPGRPASSMADDGSSVDPGRATHLIGLVRSAVPPMHRGGRPIVGGLAIGTLAAARRCSVGSARSEPGGWSTRVGLAATAGSALFFRAPKRVTPTDVGLVVAPADGLVSLIEDAVPPAELGLDPTPRPRVSIFLSVLRRARAAGHRSTGIVTHRAYRPGAFLSADLDKASADNERNSLVIGAAGGGRDRRHADRRPDRPAHRLRRRHRRPRCWPGRPTVSSGSVHGWTPICRRAPGPRCWLGQRTIGGETVLGTLRPPDAATRPA